MIITLRDKPTIKLQRTARKRISDQKASQMPAIYTDHDQRRKSGKKSGYHDIKTDMKYLWRLITVSDIHIHDDRHFMF